MLMKPREEKPNQPQSLFDKINALTESQFSREQLTELDAERLKTFAFPKSGSTSYFDPYRRFNDDYSTTALLSTSKALSQQAKLLHHHAVNNKNVDSLTDALALYLKSLSQEVANSSEKSLFSQDLESISEICNYIGLVYIDLKIFNVAIAYLKLSLKIRSAFCATLKEKNSCIIENYFNLAAAYDFNNDNALAEKYYHKTLDAAFDYFGDKPSLVLAKIYRNISSFYEKINHIDIAIRYSQLEYAYYLSEGADRPELNVLLARIQRLTKLHAEKQGSKVNDGKVTVKFESSFAPAPASASVPAPVSRVVSKKPSTSNAVMTAMSEAKVTAGTLPAPVVTAPKATSVVPKATSAASNKSSRQRAKKDNGSSTNVAPNSMKVTGNTSPAVFGKTTKVQHPAIFLLKPNTPPASVTRKRA